MEREQKMLDNNCTIGLCSLSPSPLTAHSVAKCVYGTLESPNESHKRCTIGPETRDINRVGGTDVSNQIDTHIRLFKLNSTGRGSVSTRMQKREKTESEMKRSNEEMKLVA